MAHDISPHQPLRSFSAGANPLAKPLFSHKMCDSLDQQSHQHIGIAPEARGSPFVWSGLLAIPQSLELGHMDVNVSEDARSTSEHLLDASSDYGSTSSGENNDGIACQHHSSASSDGTAEGQHPTETSDDRAELPVMCSTLLLRTKEALLKVESLLSQEDSASIHPIVDVAARLVEMYWNWVQRAFPDREEAFSRSGLVSAWLKGIPDGSDARTYTCVVPCIRIGSYVADDEEARFVLLQLLQFRVSKLRVLLESVFGHDLDFPQIDRGGVR